MKIPGYDIIQKIGEGSVGIVWKGHQVSLDRIVAIKILRDELLSDPEEISDFIKEARSAAQLKHPNLVQVYDVANKDGKYYFVMEYIDGPTVTKLIDVKGVIPQKHALKIIRQVADALKSAWDQNRLIHRDIKPDNIVIDSDGTTKLADLGLAKQVSRKRPTGNTQANMIAGTPNYMSPEQASGRTNLDARSDMYSLGATLYHMLTGKMPFEDNNQEDTLSKQITDFLVNPRNINPGISIAAARLIAVLMMKSPSDRYADWDAVIDDIKKVQTGRMLKGNSDNDGMSTIRPQKKQTNRIRSGQATKTVTDSKKIPIPMTVKVLAWTLIITWWAFMASIFINKPDVISRHITGADQLLPSSEETSLLSMPELPTPAPELIEPDTETSPDENITAESEQPAPLDESAKEDSEYIKELKSSLADMLITENFKAAGALLEQKKKESKGKPEAAEVSKVFDFVKNVSGINNAVRKSFEKCIGNTIMLNYNKRKCNLILRAISGDTINALLLTGPKGNQKEKRVKFSLSKLSYAERARWLKEKPNPVQSAMKYILYMENKNHRVAQKYAPNCGPFSKTFVNQVKSRIPEPEEQETAE